MIFLGRIVNTTQNQCRMKYADTELKVGKIVGMVIWLEEEEKEEDLNN